ncbi:MAG: ABC transporter permease [Ilumatobacter fluminis]|uniref:Transport permease protein n=1 Tax=Ilumatobacter fluminis TaxID=467091 RepID=A0A4R7I169_9ACTN|nr:ABC transporter permease [Ilumatobacter fluminis]TDT17297.1 ABC-2 type transport system permease protein [Ilumatobacter fluminis]
MSSATELFARRELLWNLTLRELRGRYKRSILGWGWSLLNPIAFMLIYTFAFSIVLRAEPPAGDPSGLDSYAFFLLCGLVPWTFFSVAVSTSMGAIVGNAALVGKVAFPREHLVISTVMAGLFTLGVELGVLSIALLIAGNMVLPWLPVAVLVSALLAMFATGLGLALAAASVYFRDMNYLWGIVMQAWFFLTPIVYPPKFVEDEFADYPTLLRIYNNIPITTAVRMYRNLLYDLRMPRLIDFGVLGGTAIVVLLAGWWLFDRLEGRFAEEL